MPNTGLLVKYLSSKWLNKDFQEYIKKYPLKVRVENNKIKVISQYLQLPNFMQQQQKKSNDMLYIYKYIYK